MKPYEIVEFDPDNPDTYPSVCADPGEVATRFGFVGGETLLFDEHGSYVGQIVMTMPSAGEERDESRRPS